jgi:hypothetical protein
MIRNGQALRITRQIGLPTLRRESRSDGKAIFLSLIDFDNATNPPNPTGDCGN